MPVSPKLFVETSVISARKIWYMLPF